MSVFSTNKQQAMRSVFKQAGKGFEILLLVVSCLLSSISYASAQSDPQQPQALTHQTFLPVSLKPGQVFYVAPNGNDTNSGTINNPWRTIAKASSMVQPGTTIYLRGGTYNEYVSFRTSGNSQEAIKILAYPGENPIIDGQYNNPGSYAALLVIRGDYIQVSGIEVRNSALMGVYVYGNHDLVSNLNVHHNRENGILVTHGSYSTVQNNQVWRNVLSNEFGQASSWSTGLSAARDGVNSVTIRDNAVWENWGEGISTFEANNITIEDNITHDNFVNNIYISDATNILCQRNFVYTDARNTYTSGYGDHEGIALGDEVYNPPSSNITIINNISVGNKGNFWWWQGPQGGGMNNVLIANNTFINGMGEAGHYWANVIISGGTHQNVRFENNIIQQEDDLPIIDTVSQPGITYTHNLWSKPPETAASGTGDIIANPQFVHIGNPFLPSWYDLLGVSPAVDAAISLTEVPQDYYGQNRLPLPDIGADEFFPTP